MIIIVIIPIIISHLSVSPDDSGSDASICSMYVCMYVTEVISDFDSSPATNNLNDSSQPREFNLGLSDRSSDSYKLGSLLPFSWCPAPVEDEIRSGIKQRIQSLSCIYWLQKVLFIIYRRWEVLHKLLFFRLGRAYCLESLYGRE